MPSASEYFTPAAAAFSKDVNQFINELAEWCEQNARAGQANAKTIRDHLTTPRKNASVAFVVSLLDYLYAHELTVGDRVRFRDAVTACRDFLSVQKQVLGRYGQPLHSEPGRSDTIIESYAGVYALLRRETSTKKFREELVVLRQIPASRKAERLATYISGELVFRGTWESVGNVLCIHMHGYRPGHRPDIANLALVADEASGDILCGHLSGLTTRGGRDPVFMAVLAIRIRNATGATLEIGNEADQYLVSRLGTFLTEVDPEVLKLIEPNAANFEPVRIDPSNDVLESLSGAVASPDQLVSAKLRGFCRDFSSQAPMMSPGMPDATR